MLRSRLARLWRVRCSECGAEIYAEQMPPRVEADLGGGAFRLPIATASGGPKNAMGVRKYQWCRACSLSQQSVRLTKGHGQVVFDDDPSPWDENNVRHLEDCRGY